MLTRKSNEKSAVRLLLPFIAAIAVLVFAGMAYSQDPQSTPETTYGGYNITATTEFGWRGRSLDGNELKYKSDLNYKRGFRFFDSNLYFSKEDGKWFDSLLIMNSGWGADPSGNFRLNMEKFKYFKLNFNTRRVKYFNNLANYVSVNGQSQHTQDWIHNLSDLDFTLFPQSRKLRLNFGASFSDASGDGTWTARAYRDDFVVPNNTKLTAKDFRLGAEGELWGFNWGLTQGFRTFKDLSNYIQGPGTNPGNNTTDTTVYTSYSKYFPTVGDGSFTQFNVNRTFAQKFDLTGRIIYSTTSSRSNITESFTGRDNSNNYVDSDQFLIDSQSKRPQTRGDVGVTWRITDNFRLSNTLTYDRFTVNGGEFLREYFNFRNAAQTTTTYRTVNSYAYRVNDYDRLANTVEADYEFNNAFSVHVGWRHTKRKINVYGTEGSVTTNVIVPTPSVLPTPSISSAVIGEDEENSTNTLIAGMKIKPTKGWVIFWDVEHGTSDNVFSRLENYDFTNFRGRSRWQYKTFTVNVSALTKNNTNPSLTYDTPPLPFGTDITSRTFTGDVEWNPVDRFRLSGGYTYRNQTAKTPIYTWIGTVPSSGIKTLGTSEFYVRDRYAYIEMSARAHKRLSIYAAYRMNKDNGQGDIVSPPAANSANIIASYPMRFNTPEVRAAIRLTKNIDWNIGYQYYDYKDVQTSSLNYKAHLPYTSLRIYFGGRAADR